MPVSRRPLLWVAVALLAPGHLPAVTDDASGAPAESLEVWLPRLDRAAQLYRDAALSFACNELISWMDQKGKTYHLRFDYMFAFDEESGFHDYRTLPRDRGDPRSRPVSPAKMGVPFYLEQAYLWAFTFLQSRWPSHEYGFAGTDRVLGRPAVGISFRALPPFQQGVNEWVGVAWVDRETAQFLRVEARRPEPGGEWRIPFRDELDGLKTSVVTEFGVERNGMRFPSRARIDAMRGRTDPEVRVLRIEQAFRNYEFFHVRTAEEIRRTVLQAP